MREWKDYHNTQKYSECQLVTALNAYYHLTGKIIKQDSKRYESLVDLCGARYGSAISIEKVHKRLGIKPTKLMFCPFMVETKSGKIKFLKKTKLPLEASVWHKSTGYHSVLIVDYESKTDAYRVANFKGATNRQGWIFAEDFQHYTVSSIGNSVRQSCPQCEDKDKRWQYRLYELDK